MATVEINAGGRYVKVIQDGRDAELLMPLAEQAWKMTEGATQEPEGSAMGFLAERRGSVPIQPLGPGHHGHGKERAPVQA